MLLNTDNFDFRIHGSPNYRMRIPEKDIPSPEDYETKMGVFLHRVYLATDKLEQVNREPVIQNPSNLKRVKPIYKRYGGGETVLDMIMFKDREKATTVIKKWLSNGANSFAHFNRDYTCLIIYRDAFTDRIINQKIKANKAKKEQVQCAENRV